MVAGWKISRQWIKKSGVDIPFSDCSFVRSIEDLITNGIGCCVVPMFFYFGIFNKKENLFIVCSVPIMDFYKYFSFRDVK